MRRDLLVSAGIAAAAQVLQRHLTVRWNKHHLHSASLDANQRHRAAVPLPLCLAPPPGVTLPAPLCRCPNRPGLDPGAATGGHRRICNTFADGTASEIGECLNDLLRDCFIDRLLGPPASATPALNISLHRSEWNHWQCALHPIPPPIPSATTKQQQLAAVAVSGMSRSVQPPPWAGETRLDHHVPGRRAQWRRRMERAVLDHRQPGPRAASPPVFQRYRCGLILTYWVLAAGRASNPHTPQPSRRRLRSVD